MYVDFLGDKAGARLNYGKYIEISRGDTLLSEFPEYDIPRMYLCEDRAFVESCISGVKNRNYIDNILETMKVLDALYQSADKKEEIKF